MILVDENLLVYAQGASFPHHEAAREWLDGKLNGAAPVGLPWESLPSFLRLVTNPRVFEQPEPAAAAWAQVQAWLGNPDVWIPLPTENHRAVLGDQLSASGARANLAPDAHLAALAVEHGLVLCSADGDLARLPGLRWENPLAG